MWLLNAARAGSMLALLAGLPVRMLSQVREARTGAPQEVRVTAADGRLLVEEALAQGDTRVLSLTLQPGASAFRVEEGRIILLATAQSGPLICPVRISGVPAIRANRLALLAPDIGTDGMLCNSALNVLRQKSLESLAAHPWDLAERLARASVDPSLPGPRLPATGCLAASQVRLRAVRARAAYLAVSVTVLPRGAGEGCG
jgi:hypothetical protein